MGVPGADVRYVLESLGEIEDAMCNGPGLAKGKQYAVDACGYCCGDALRLLRELKAKLEAIT